MILQSLHLVLLIVPLLFLYLYSHLRWRRFKRYAGLPMPKTSLLWGHLELVGKSMKEVGALSEKKKHPDYGFEAIHKQIGSPGLLFLDLWPVSYPTIQIWSHSLAEQISRPSKGYKYSVDKSPTMGAYHDLIGKESVLIANGEKWKNLRRRFNAGFAPQHLITLLPQIISKTEVFLTRLDELCKSGEKFEMDSIATELTFDIIGAVVLDVDFHAQDATRPQSPILAGFREMISFYMYLGSAHKLRPTYLWELYRRKQVSKKLNNAVKSVIREKYAQQQSEEKSSEKGRSVLALSLRGIPQLTPEVEEQISASVRTFLFAGHDTTSITLQWALYFLHVTPRAQAALTAELDDVLGKETSPLATARLIRDRGDQVLSKLTYLSAIIKEVLRIYPPAASARMSPEGTGHTLRLEDGSDVCIDGLVIYIVHYGIHRDPKVFGPDADEFRPERWLGNTDMSAASSIGDASPTQDASAEQIPASAWRPFERGPRNCIGQELANLEAKVIIATIARGYVFEKIGIGRLVNGVVEEPMYKKFTITSRPVDDMKMKVRSASQRT